MNPLKNNWFRRAVLTGMILLPLTLATPVKARAYTDPGTGTFAYQAIYAAFIGGTFYFRKLVKRLFDKRSDK
jgi:hypothetical protein